jgi:hypothetical protein
MTTLSENEKQAQELIAQQICATIDALDAHFTKFCENVKGTSVPLIYIKKSLEIYKENFTKEALK